MSKPAAFKVCHFVAIADMLKDLHSIEETDRTWVAEYFAGQLERTSPKFDRARFLTACNAADRI